MEEAVVYLRKITKEWYLDYYVVTIKFIIKHADKAAVNGRNQYEICESSVITLND